MDSTRKPERRNPRQGARPWSQLFFGWVMPILWYGCRTGLDAEQLTLCLPADNSTDLGDKLERAWQREQETAKRRKRGPLLRRALFRVFISSAIVDGFLLLSFILVKTLLPVVLAQLLKQFQPPIPAESLAYARPELANVSPLPLLQLPSDVLQQQETSTNRSARSIDHDLDDRIRSFNVADDNAVATSSSLRARRELFGTQSSENSLNNTSTDGIVSRVPVKAPPVIQKSEKDEQFRVDEATIALRSAMGDYAVLMWNDMRWLGVMLIGLAVFAFLIEHHANLRQQMLGARMRIACCSLIYRKTLRLSKKSAGRTAAGYLVNLLSNDVNRLDLGFVYAHYVWILPLQSCLVTYLIYQEAGAAAFVGVIGLLLLTVPVQTGLSRLLSKLRMLVALRTDERVGIMHEIIVGIQVIKMYAWEKPFQAVVSEARRQEVRQVRFASYIRGINMCTMVFMERATLFMTICACVMLGQRITAAVVFSMAQFFNVLQLTAAIFYPLALALGAEALVSIGRVEEFLLMEERSSDSVEELLAAAAAATATTEGAEDDDEEAGNGKKSTAKKNSKKSLKAEAKSLLGRRRPSSALKPAVLNRANAIELNNVTASWDEEANAHRTLQDIVFNVRAGTLCAIIGPVGAGKSSLLHLLLGELPLLSGRCSLAADAVLSYASQEPWLFTGTVRHNILFGQAYDSKRYHEVVQCCALATDFEQLPNGDKTIVGERGTSLSGGQRARISLARAVYKRATIYLLDDPLSAVDAHVGKHLFDEVIGPNGRLARLKQTRLLVTHQVHFLKEADLIVILDGGRILRTGTYAQLANSELDFARLLRKGSDDAEDMDAAADGSGASDADEDDDIPYMDGYQQVRRNRSESDTTARSKSNKSLSSTTKSTTKSTEDFNDDDEEERNREEKADGGVSLSVWKSYFLAGGSVCKLVALFAMLLFSQVVTSGSDYFVNYWTQQEDRRVHNLPTPLTQFEYLYVYGALIAGVVTVCFLRGFMFFNICMHASKVLHDRMFRRLLMAPMRFFDTNPSGRILNRFSKDMGAIDEMLPKAMMESIQIGLVMVGILVMVSIVNPLMIGMLVVSVVLFTLILKLYLRPSQDLKRLEGISRSPVFSHLSASLTGISTIRSCGLQQRLIREFDGLQDVHSAVWQLATSANTALGLWLDCVSVAFVTAVTFSFISLYGGNTFSGNVGLAISQALILTGMVQYGVRQSAMAMQQMTSVERVLQYTDLKSEVQPEREPPATWPVRGHVKFEHMSLSYDTLEPPTLIDLNLDIAAGWKVGIVGRTGAGKSSLISALFRLAPIEGSIFIDGIETASITLDSLRSSVSIIPQDPVLFSATIRSNLDPFDRYSDDLLWQALGAVELRGQIVSLDHMVTEAGANFSVGQRQLICLARAILRNNRVLVLDEATANVDPQTDALIQRTIRERFAECTVLTVAHRLHTVMDSDRIVVMDAGRVREFDWPAVLLDLEGGVLRDMVDACGPQEATSLKRIAAETMATKMAVRAAEPLDADKDTTYM